MIRTSIALFLVLFLYQSAIAQTGEVRGFVYQEKTGEPSIFTNVQLKGTRYGAKTDVNGFYSITKIPEGQYTLIACFLGFDTAKIDLNIQAGKKLSKNLYIKESAINLKSVDVNAERISALTDVKISTTQITPKQISQIPSIGGEADLAQYLQVLPGVIFTGDQGGQLYVRGGSPIQNQVLLDGMIVYNPFHSIGLFSVFDVDILRNVDVYTGGFNAEYGGRISAVMDVTTRDGNKKRLSGKFSSSPIASHVLLEGPLVKYVEGKYTSSFILSGKSSYLDKTSKTLYSYADKNGLPYSFTDLYGKVSVNDHLGNKFNVFGFNFSDQVNYSSLAALSWKANGVGMNFVVVPPESSTLISGNFAYSGYAINLKETSNTPRNSSINGFNGGFNFDYFFGDNELKYGLDLLGFKTALNFTNASNLRITQDNYTTELAFYSKYKLVKKGWVIEPSFRGHYYASLDEFSPEPRLGIKYNMTDNLRFKLAGGLFSQNLVSATSDRDVVNLFYGFLSAPESLPKKFDGTEVSSALQKARHAIVGVEYDLTSKLTINVEGYIKRFNQLTTINRDKIYNDNATNNRIPDQLKKDFIIETGMAKGVDAVLKYEYKQLYLWFVYSLAFSDRYDGTMHYTPHYDRRHNINMVGTYHFGKKKTWEIDARWNFGSGLPFTQTQGFYEHYDFQDGINTNVTTANGNLGIQYANLNGARLPYYHRLDISMKKKWDLSRWSKLELSAGATNVYNRDNIFYFDRIQYSRKNQLPILPSIAAAITF